MFNGLEPPLLVTRSHAASGARIAPWRQPGDWLIKSPIASTARPCPSPTVMYGRDRRSPRHRARLSRSRPGPLPPPQWFQAPAMKTRSWRQTRRGYCCPAAVAQSHWTHTTSINEFSQKAGTLLWGWAIRHFGSVGNRRVAAFAASGRTLVRLSVRVRADAAALVTSSTALLGPKSRHGRQGAGHCGHGGHGSHGRHGSPRQ